MWPTNQLTFSNIIVGNGGKMMRVRMFYPLTINDYGNQKDRENYWCEYIEGDLSFLCVIAGYNPEELTPKYPDYIKERVLALYDATYWWYEYGLNSSIF